MKHNLITTISLVISIDSLIHLTMQNICKDNDINDDYPELYLPSLDYIPIIIEDTNSIAKTGNLVFCGILNYGGDEYTPWTELGKIKKELQEWAEKTCNKYKGSYIIKISSQIW